MKLDKIYKYKLKKYRDKIDRGIKQVIQDNVKEKKVREMSIYATENGRRFRPLLFLLAYLIFNPHLEERVYRLAVAIELLHKASLVHDDYFDRDEYRRGKISFPSKYGERKAIITGDLLVSLSLREFNDCCYEDYLRDEWHKLYYLLVTGEIKDILWEDREDIKYKEVETMVYEKTASFLEFVLKSGAYLGSGKREIAEQMGQFGRQIGFAFQIMNDLNNWSGLEKKLGREVRGDMNSGKINPITILAYNTGIEVKDRNSLQDFVKMRAQKLAGNYIKKGEKHLDEVDVNNYYMKILRHIINEFDKKWFWLDRDD